MPCADSPTATHPYTTTTQDINHAVAKRSVPELPAGVSGGFCTVYASSSCGKLVAPGGTWVGGREGYKIDWPLTAAGAAAGATAVVVDSAGSDSMASISCTGKVDKPMHWGGVRWTSSR
mgnify:CR=1 FL=1